MRPRLDAAENAVDRKSIIAVDYTSMRPRLDAAENVLDRVKGGVITPLQ